MLRTDVVVVPVALVPSEDDQLRMMAYVPDGRFLREQINEKESVEQCAEGVASSATADLPVSSLDSGTDGPRTTLRMEEVGFAATGSSVRLVFTTVLPLADLVGAASPSATRDDLKDWMLLTPWVGRGNMPDDADLPVEQVLVRNYWRRQLEETTAILEFLPRYFTTGQVRDAYSSLWGAEQHVGAFHRWLHDRDDHKISLVKPANEDDVRKHVELAFAVALQRSELGPQIAPNTQQLSASSGVGMSVAMVAGSALGFLPAALLAGAVVGGVVAYQQRTGRGKKPHWYESAQRERILIDDPYAPRPVWLPIGGRPAPFH